MKVERIVQPDGSTHEIISFANEETDALDYCHNVLQKRFETRNKTYSDEQRRLCEWWLVGLLRYKGMEKMIEMAKTAPFPEKNSE